MSKPKFDIFDLQSGEFDDPQDSEEKIEKLSEMLSNEAGKLKELYKAEIEIVRSILEKALEVKENDRSTD